MPTLESFLDEHQKQVESLEADAGIAYWNASISGSKSDEDRAATFVAQLLAAYSSPDQLNFLRSLVAPVDHDLNRQRLLLIDEFQANQLSEEVIRDLAAREMEIETIFSNFRSRFRGELVSDNSLQGILKKSLNVNERRDAWEASKQVGAEVSGRVLALVEIRNREAKRLGYDNFYAMSIALQELDEDWLFDTLGALSERIDPSFNVYKAELDLSLAQRFTIAVEDIFPWHYSNPFFQDAPEDDETALDSYFSDKDLTKIASDFFNAIGFSIAHVLSLSDLYEKPGKSQHAYCTSIGRGTHDVRILCNLIPNCQWMATLLHELGHAVYDDLIDDELPFFLQTCTHTMTTEAIAELMGRLVNNGAWLQRYAGVGEAEAERVAAATQKTNRGHLLIFTKWVLVMAHFERSLYQNPEQDLDELWWTLVEKYQKLRRPPGPRNSDWAAKVHLSTSPVYYHNYLLGEMTASQILWALRKDVAKVDDQLIGNPGVGQWLTENIFRHGARYHWNELLKRATGEPLNPAYLINEIVE